MSDNLAYENTTEMLTFGELQVMPYDPEDARHAVQNIAEQLQKQGIGDVNSDAKGSGARYNTGKADLSLIPLSTLEDEARVWMYGAKKYKAFNWMKGMQWSVPLACALRHLAAFQNGEDIDEESGQPHIAHAMCNLRMLTLYSKTYKEGDDRPPKEYMNATD